MERKFEFGTPHFGVFTGLGVEFISYKFENDIILSFNNDSTFALPGPLDSTGVSTGFLEQEGLRKNKLRQIGVRVPLMLEINTSKTRKRSFHLAAGLIGSLYFDTLYKRKFRVEDRNVKERNRGDYNLLPYRLAASVRFGYGSLNLFVEASLTELFEQGKGPELYPFNVGLTLVSF